LSDERQGITVGERLDAHCVALTKGNEPLSKGMRCQYARKMTLTKAYKRFRAIAVTIDPFNHIYRESIKSGAQETDRFYIPDEETQEIKPYHGKAPAPDNIWIIGTVMYIWHDGQLLIDSATDEYKEEALIKHTADATLIEYWRVMTYPD
jgi:hypothetical protein